jgi:hypothetical protein
MGESAGKYILMRLIFCYTYGDNSNATAISKRYL